MVKEEPNVGKFIWNEAMSGIRDDSAYRGHFAQASRDSALGRDMAKARRRFHLIRESPQVTTAD